MKTLLTTTALVLVLAATGQTQSRRWIHALEWSAASGQGGGDYGLSIRAHHEWNDSTRWVWYSGVEAATFWGSERSDNESFTTTGFTADHHVRFRSGLSVAVDTRRKVTVNLEGYVGGYFLHTQGNLRSDTWNIDRDYSSEDSFLDFGSRIAVAFQPWPRLGFVADLQNSWRQIPHPLGPLTGWFAGEPDGKYSFGLGVIWRFQPAARFWRKQDPDAPKQFWVRNAMR